MRGISCRSCLELCIHLDDYIYLQGPKQKCRAISLDSQGSLWAIFKNGSIYRAKSNENELKLIVGGKSRRNKRHLEADTRIEIEIDEFKFVFPSCLETRALNSIYVCDSSLASIYEIKDESVVRIAGNGQKTMKDGPLLEASFTDLRSIVWISPSLYVLDNLGKTIRIVNMQTETVSTLDVLLPEKLASSDSFQFSRLISCGETLYGITNSPLGDDSTDNSWKIGEISIGKNRSEVSFNSASSPSQCTLRFIAEELNLLLEFDENENSRLDLSPVGKTHIYTSTHFPSQMTLSRGMLSAYSITRNSFFCWDANKGAIVWFKEVLMPNGFPIDLSSIMRSPIRPDFHITHASTGTIWYLHWAVLRSHPSLKSKSSLLDLLASNPKLDVSTIQALVDYLYYVPLVQPVSSEECMRFCHLAALAKELRLNISPILVSLRAGLDGLSSSDAFMLSAKLVWSFYYRDAPMAINLGERHLELYHTLYLRVKSMHDTFVAYCLKALVSLETYKPHLRGVAERFLGHQGILAGGSQIPLPLKPLRAHSKKVRWTTPMGDNVSEVRRALLKTLSATPTDYALAYSQESYLIVNGCLLYPQWPWFRQTVNNGGQEVTLRIIQLPHSSIMTTSLVHIMNYLHTRNHMDLERITQAEAYNIIDSAVALSFIDTETLIPLPGFDNIIAICRQKLDLKQRTVEFMWTTRIHGCSDLDDLETSKLSSTSSFSFANWSKNVYQAIKYVFGVSTDLTRWLSFGIIAGKLKARFWDPSPSAAADPSY